VIVTGASDGIGAAAAIELARHGDRVVIVGRSPEKTQAVAERVEAAAGEPVEMHCADFARLDQVRALGATLAAAHPRIDVLVDNAGQSTAGDRTVTEDGYELTFQVNHLGPSPARHGGRGRRARRRLGAYAIHPTRIDLRSCIGRRPATTALGWRADTHNPLVDAFIDIARSVRDAPSS
jgi:NAD(P)-dependent dehydrogenase (short-subunit alcohol dehydrogenase family)